MRRLFELKSWLLALLVATVSVGASASASASVKPALWQVEHQGRVSYLLGSIHVGKASWYPLSAPIEQAYQQADSLVVEVDMLTHISDVQSAMMLPPGQTIKQHLSKKTYATVVDYLKQQHIPEQAVASFTPWALGSTFAVLPYLKLGLDPNMGIDSKFLSRAKKDRKPIIELESAQFQINLLTTLFGSESALLDIMAMPDSEAVKLLSIWKVGDVAAMEQLVKEQMTAQEYKLMLLDRNQDWTNKLLPLFANKDSLFIVVGAAHLVGLKGLPELLIKRGYRVTRVQ